MHIQSQRKTLTLLIILLISVFIISLFIGRYKISISEILTNMGTRIIREESINSNDWNVFFYIRLPRIILVTIVGAILSMTGATYQSVFRNPLASPSILGVSAGSAFGVALGILLNKEGLLGPYLFSFSFGLIAVFLTFYISVWSKVKGVTVLVLAGMAVTSFFNAGVSLIQYLADPYEKLPNIVFWLMGGFNRAGWREVYISLFSMVPGIIILLILRWHLNVMSMGDEEAISMGVNVKWTRILLIFVSTVMIVPTVAVAGQVTWIGLVTPHIARYIIGANHRYMLPAAGVLGGILLLIMDNIARTLTPSEIPISIVTAFIGAPFFVYLLIRRRESGWNQ
ncbi:FecCD family ABC transporter permease [Petrotoga halophila]|uniref:ABC transporter permease n=1 Tax=Petrotoga halophila DSM 16923 TaxID=1122953 RepID=A0A2S5EDK6_9BACT|nr:iron ABC transporter permease [Petrotoga halophila]POZ91243.1 ABC transporter permease [Petrotoga halophila DSM 16923]